MKLLIVAVAIAVTSAARLEQLERGYLPPGNTNGNRFGTNSAFAFGFNSGRNGLGNGNRLTNGFGSNGHGSNGIGSNGQSTNGFGTNSRGHGNDQSTTAYGSNGNGAHGTNGFGSNGGRNGFAGATSNQYLPPDQAGSNGNGAGFNYAGSSIRPACSNCGQSRYTQQHSQAALSIPGTSYGVPQFGSSLTSTGGSNIGSHFASGSPSSSGATEHDSDSTFGSSNGNLGSNSFGSQGFVGSQGGADRQYLPPRQSSQNPHQQLFDEDSGYIY